MKPNKHNIFPQNQTLSSLPRFEASEAAYTPSPDEVARRAYFSYENQGAHDGHAVQHWLAAEAELIAERNLTRTHHFHNQS